MSGDVIITMCSPPSAGGTPIWEEIDSGTVSGSPEYLDFSLPTGYREYIIRFYNLTQSGVSALAFAFSANAGVDFYNAAGSYRTTPAYATASAVSDVLGFLSSLNQDWDDEMQAVLRIVPGATGKRAVVSAEASFYETTAGFTESSQMSVYLVEATGLQNLIRILPYGNGDVDPPTSGATFTGGSWVIDGRIN